MELYNASVFDDNATGGVLAECTTAKAGSVSPAYLRYKMVVDVYAVGAICLFGFLGNALSIAVLHRDAGRHRTTAWLLKTLAAVDTAYLAACVLIQPLKTAYATVSASLPAAMVRAEPYVWVVASTAQTATVWMVVFVTFDRYVAVCRPLERHLRSPQRARRAVIVLATAAVLYNMPRFFERVVYECRASDGGGVVLRTRKTWLGDNEAYFIVYKTLFYLVFRAFGPLISLIVLNARLIRALRAVRRKHRHMKKTSAPSSASHENLTLMLIAVVIVFFVCEIPDLLLRLVMTARHLKITDVSIETLRYVNAFTNMLLTINSSVNFIIYCVIGKRFRRVLVKICCRDHSLANGAFSFTVGTAHETHETEMCIADGQQLTKA